MNNKYPKREVPTLEEIKMALNTYERIEADEKILFLLEGVLVIG